MDEGPSTGGHEIKRCVECGYAQRGLPVEHACPECGRKYDEHSREYRPSSSGRLLLIWCMIFFGAAPANLTNLRHLVQSGRASTWDLTLGFFAIVYFIGVSFGGWVLYKRFRRGFRIAVTADGLCINLPGYPDRVVAWDQVDRAEIHDPGKGIRQLVVKIHYRDGSKKPLPFSSLTQVFSTVDDAKAFGDLVNMLAEKYGRSDDQNGAPADSPPHDAQDKPADPEGAPGCPA